MMCRVQVLALSTLILTSCGFQSFLSSETNEDQKPDLRITLGEVYLGVRDGNVESIALPVESEYLTVEICVENISNELVTVSWRDVYAVAGDDSQYYPSALGLDQAEAFNWVLPLIEPIGGKRIERKYYFFLIQDEALMTLPARGANSVRNLQARHYSLFYPRAYITECFNFYLWVFPHTCLSYLLMFR